MKTLRLLALAVAQFVEAGGVKLLVQWLRESIAESRQRQQEYEYQKRARALATGDVDAIESDIERLLSEARASDDNRPKENSSGRYQESDSDSHNVTMDGSNATVEALQREISLIVDYHGSK